MYEDRPELDTPPRIRVLLHHYGGSTPDGRPLWRLILAQRKRIRAAGVMRTMPQGDDVRSGNGRVAVSIPKPDKIEEGVFFVPRYRFSGWILERWFPGDTWGTEQLWDSQRHGADGRTRMMAERPRRGDYFMIPGAGPWPNLEAAGDLRAAIRDYMKQEREKPSDWDAYLRGEIATEMAERNRLAEQYEDRMAAIGRGEVQPVLGSLSLSAQRVRDQVAVDIGGEDWHLGAF